MYHLSVYTVSAGIRFTTLPDSALQTASSSKTTPFSQPPTICTATFTPITGHLSAAYAAKVSRDLALCSRFTFNINSFESEWTMGGEWWLRRKKPVLDNVSAASDPPPVAFSISEGTDPPLYRPEDEIQGVVKARLSTSSVRLPPLSETPSRLTIFYVPGHRLHVGRTYTQCFGQLWCDIQPRQPLETYYSCRIRTCILQLGMNSLVLISNTFYYTTLLV